jgi:hypothetical protein
MVAFLAAGAPQDGSCLDPTIIAPEITLAVGGPGVGVSVTLVGVLWLK